MKEMLVHSQQSFDALKINSDFVRRFGYDSQNYTLYPTTDYFIEAFDALAYTAWASNRKIGGVRRPLSLYVHIPFCSAICFYCKYNQSVTNDRVGFKKYFDYLLHEISLQGELFRNDPKVEQLYVGGGTPTSLRTDQLSTIMNKIQQNFNLLNKGDYSIEVNPRQGANLPMAALREIGFNHVIVTVQDFGKQVQQAAHHFQTEDDTCRIIYAAQNEGFKSVSVELIYGLPKQSVENFAHTLERIIVARPNQITLFNYLHLLEKFKLQRSINAHDFINAHDLPPAEARFEFMLSAMSRLSNAGYIHLGMNCFAGYDDELATAQRQGRLHYNLQGYSIHADSDLVALGVSAIGSIGPTYNQNHRDLHRYYDSLEQNILPVMRGLELTADDLLRRTVMHALICHSVLSFESIETFFLIDFKHYFTLELTELLTYEKFGLLTLDDGEITITPEGRWFIGSICMVFDKYLRASNARRHYSKIN